jgi:hypothetical protein
MSTPVQASHLVRGHADGVVNEVRVALLIEELRV